MDADFWQARWREGRIGFHQGQPNEHLVAYEDRLRLAGARVLVPLCGKSVDLAWLAARAREVVGVELVATAVEAFFEEHGLTPERAPMGSLTSFRAGNLTVFAGDLFALERDGVGVLDACWDRAALVALPPDMRERYVAHVRGLLAPGARTLLVTFEHDGPTNEPPFSVPADVVRELYAGDVVERLLSRDVFDPAGPHAARGATRASEHVYVIDRR